jgi:hypothetical protein
VPGGRVAGAGSLAKARSSAGGVAEAKSQAGSGVGGVAGAGSSSVTVPEVI